MKLRKLELTNVRRFAGRTAILGPFGDGLTTVTAENESGKSTFFDALHALLFVAHGSSSQEVKSLQPYSGGPVCIAAEIEIDGVDYRIEKSFCAQKSARVIDGRTGQILKQQGDAEAWIEETINKPTKGPAGLLWVRQGSSHVDPEGRDKDSGNIAARRDLMSSVRGQIDAVTGGRRMDRIVERCHRELDAMATKSLNAKAGSEWKRVEDRVERLTEQREKLRADVRQLSGALETKRRTKARLVTLQDPAAQADRKQQIAEAAEALSRAHHHARLVTDADTVLRLVLAEKARLIREIGDISAARALRTSLAKEIEEREAALEDTEAAQATANAALDAAQERIAETVGSRKALDATLSAARQAEASTRRWNRMREVAELIHALDAPRAALTKADEALAGTEITRRDLDALADLARRISIAREQRRAHFARVTVEPTGPGTADVDGARVEPGKEILIDRVLDLRITNFGHIRLRPADGAGRGIEDPIALQAEHDGMLDRLGFETFQHAQDAFDTRQGAMGSRSVAIAEIRGLAPDGVEALHTEWKTLCADLGHPPDADPPVPSATVPDDASVEELEARIKEIDWDIDDNRSSLKALQNVATRTAGEVAKEGGLLNHLKSQQSALPIPEDEDEQLHQLEAARDAELAKEAEATRAIERLKSDAPDLAAAQSAHERLTSAEAADREEIHRMERDLARVNGAIETQSEASVEEKLAEVEAQLEKASERADRFDLQAKALAMLIDHLDQARKEAQETYFEPIRTELRPLLAQLHAGADFELDPDKMLVGQIIRNGVRDDVSVLSGGAYEQVAILTRLAFAKLFAKQGRHVPVILDDALVHTDDERISTMFNMLSQVARDQQIIVLSCRTRAFSDLGGTRAFIDMDMDVG